MASVNPRGHCSGLQHLSPGGSGDGFHGQFRAGMDMRPLERERTAKVAQQHKTSIAE